MRKALQLLVLCVAAVMMLTAAAAQENISADAEGLMVTNPVEGVHKRPEGAESQGASFSLHYQYPQFDAENDADQAINEYYQALAADAAMVAEAFDEARITCEITHNTKRYLSVVQSLTVQSGNGQRETISADTFARDGLYAGQPLSLSQVLGLEETDELSSALGMAETIAYELVWQIVTNEMQSHESDYPEGLTMENLQSVLMPETDFYLDADGNIVFFIQAGELAGEIAGVLRFPFAAAELLSFAYEP